MTDSASTMQSAVCRTGALIPHFEVATVDGNRVKYADLWQRRNVVVLTLPDKLDDTTRRYAAELQTRLAELKPDDTTLIVVVGSVHSLPASSLIVADRWGEIAHIEELSPDIAAWPSAIEIVEWVEFVRSKCPECPAR
jgi:hypothetical protein